LRLIGDGSPELRRIWTDLGVGGAGVLAKIARRWFSFTFKAEYAYDSGMPQWLATLDHLLSPLHPERLFFGRHKFAHFRVWYRDALSPYIQDVLLGSRALARPYLEAKTVRSIVQAHLRGTRNFTAAIHKLLTLELLHRRLVDSAIEVEAMPQGGPVLTGSRCE
jgi:asparagine synthase (glutamine-hydrolysing)